MSLTKIEFFFDVVSPYSYIASEQIEALANSCQVELQWRPFLLGGVFKETGNQPPGMLPSRGKYLLKDLKRKSKFFQIPFTMPKMFPINSMLAMRTLCSFAENELPEKAHRVFRAYWVDNQAINNEAVIKELLGAEALAKAEDSDIKEKLRANTEEAVKRGAFGAPTFFIGDEMFFGSDRLMFMQAYLEGKL